MEYIIRKKIFLGTYMFYMISMLICSSAFGVYLPNFASKVVNILCIFMLSIGEIANHKYTIRQIAILINLLILAIINYIISNDVAFVLSLVFIYCSHDIEFRDITKWTIIILAIMLPLIIISAKIGIIANYIGNGILGVRECIGFLYPLVSSTLFCNLIFLVAYYKKWLISWKYIIIFFFTNIFIMLWTTARLGSTLVFIFLFILILCKITKTYYITPKIFQLIIVCSYFICCFIGFYFSYNYNSSDIYYILADIVLSGRLALGYEALSTYPVTMFGLKLPLVGNGLDVNGLPSDDKAYFWIDCIYIKLLLQNGVIIAGTYILSFTKLLYNYARKKDFITMLILSLMGLHGLIDDAIMYIMYNPFLLMIGSELISKKQAQSEAIL